MLGFLLFFIIYLLFLLVSFIVFDEVDKGMVNLLVLIRRFIFLISVGVRDGFIKFYMVRREEEYIYVKILK